VKRNVNVVAGRSCADWGWDSLGGEGVLDTFDKSLIHHRNKSWLKTILEVVERVKNKYWLDEVQSTCYYFMVDRLIISLRRLPETPETCRMNQRKFLYLGGAGGTG
jgi:hypothetical protein